MLDCMGFCTPPVLGKASADAMPWKGLVKGIKQNPFRMRKLIRPGGDLLFQDLSPSTIGAESFHGRVRDGNVCLASRYNHQAI